MRLPAQTAPGNAAQLTARIDSLFRHVTPNGPGCAVGASRNGEPLFARGFGKANMESGDPITAQTPFNIGSVGKQFTAFAVLLLEQRGRLSLDEDIRRHVPELPNYGAPIRIRDLLYHTSGLRDYSTLAALGDKPMHTTAEFLALMSRQRALNFPTGTQHEYSHSDYSVLGVVVERIVGEPLGTFFEREIWTPLGMTNTRLHDDRRRPIRGRALAYEGSAPNYRVIFPASEIIGGSNIYTTVDDLLRWERNVQMPTVGTRALFDRMVSPKFSLEGSGFAFLTVCRTYGYLRIVCGNYSAEAGAMWEIVVTRGAMAVRRPGAADTRLAPTIPGWFTGNFRHDNDVIPIGVAFPRGAASASHFLVTALPNFEIVRNLRFDRVGKP